MSNSQSGSNYFWSEQPGAIDPLLPNSANPHAYQIPEHVTRQLSGAAFSQDLAEQAQEVERRNREGDWNEAGLRPSSHEITMTLYGTDEIMRMRSRFAQHDDLNETEKTEAGIIGRIFKGRKITPSAKVITVRDLIRREAIVGGRQFGRIPLGVERKFFCLDRNSWIWDERWTDELTRENRGITTRYEVRPNGILKAQNDHPYHYVEAQEARNLIEAIKLYNQHVLAEVYQQRTAEALAA